MSRINLTVLAGNLVRDPELRYTPNGTAICEFTIANSDRFKRGDEWVEEPGYFPCMCWGKKGETINEYFKKGKPIQVEGRLKFSAWEDKDGVKKSAIKINVRDFDFIGAPPSKDTGSQAPSFPEGAAPNDVNEEEIPF